MKRVQQKNDHNYAAKKYKSTTMNQSLLKVVNSKKYESQILLQCVFENLDLSTFPQISPDAPLDALANYVIDNPQEFKKIEKKEKMFEEESLEPTMVNLVDLPLQQSNGSVLFEFMDFFHDFFEKYSQDKTLFDKNITHILLHQQFPRCRTLLIEHLVAEFDGCYSTAAAICFFVESGYEHMVRKYFLHIEDLLWNSMVSILPISRKRRKTWIDVPVDGSVSKSFKDFERFLSEAKKNFPNIFEGNLISKDAQNLIKEDKKFTCCVCFDDYPQKEAIFCSLPKIIDLLPSTSGKKFDKDPHLFCLECVRGQALAATTDMPLAEGGVGLKCMAPDCTNPILFSKYRSLIPYRVRKLLNERIIEETLGMANLENLERCKRCNYAIQFEIPTSINKVFCCFKCGFEFCRICKRHWTEKHFGKPCEELDVEDNVSRTAINLENEMSNLLIRKCHKCNLPFVKLDGCNRIYCRCGATQCYVCRAYNISYAHFCSHNQHPNSKSCKSCKKKCLLWEKIDEKIAVMVEKIRKEAEIAGIVIGKS